MRAVRSQIKLGSLVLLVIGSMIWSLSCVARAVSVQVNRTSNGSPDSFTYTSLDYSDSQLAGRTCADFNATSSVEECSLDEQQCTCTCDEKTPTFIAHLATCMKDKDVRGLFDESPGFSAEHYNGTFDGYRCPPQNLPSIDVDNGATKKLTFCNGRNIAQDILTGCIVTDVQYLNESTDGAFVKSTHFFKILLRLSWLRRSPFLKWDKAVSGSPLIGVIVLINIKCTLGVIVRRGYGRLLVKIAGSAKWDLPSASVSKTGRSTEVQVTTITATERFKPLESTPSDKGHTIAATAVISFSVQQSAPFIETAATTLSSAHDAPESWSLSTPAISTSAMYTATECLKVTGLTPTRTSYLLAAATSISLPWQRTSPSMETVSSAAVSETMISRRAFGPTGKAATPTSRPVHGVGTQETQTTGNGSNLATALSVTGGLSFAILIAVSIFLLVRRRKSRRSEAKKRAEKSSALNPIYGKGADSIMMSGELNTAYTNEDSHTYQAVVQNTREPSDCPTYTSLQRDSYKQPPAQEQSIYQALRTNSPREVQQEDQYQPLSRHSRRLPHEAIKEDTSNKDENRGTEPEYVVLEDPSEDTPSVAGPIYQVLEEGEGQGATHEDTTSEEPVYNVLEAE